MNTALGHLSAALAVLAVMWPALLFAGPTVATAAVIASIPAALGLSAHLRHRSTT